MSFANHSTTLEETSQEEISYRLEEMAYHMKWALHSLNEAQTHLKEFANHAEQCKPYLKQ